MSMNREVVPWWMERQQAIKTLTARMVAEEVVVADATTIVPYRTALRQHGQYMVSGGGPDFITGSAQAAAWEFQARVGWHAVFEAGKGGNHGESTQTTTTTRRNVAPGNNLSGVRQINNGDRNIAQRAWHRTVWRVVLQRHQL